MAKGKTPLEQSVAVQSGRRPRYDEKMRKAGNRKLTVWASETNAAVVRQLCRALCETASPEEANMLISDAISMARLGIPLEVELPS